MFLVNNTQVSNSMKHIYVCHNFFIAYNERGDIKFEFIRGEFNTSYTMIKKNVNKLFTYHRKNIF